MIKGVYAGSLDPPTKGHEWMIKEGSNLFDALIVAIGVNPDKKSTFTVDERMEMLEEITKPYKNVVIDNFSGKYLVKYASSIGAGFILRGIRNSDDYEYEKIMRHVNNDIEPNIVSVYLMPPREISEVSSSMIKGLVGSEDWESVVRRYVSEPVLIKLKEKYEAKER